MQSSGGGRSAARVRYAYRRQDDSEEEADRPESGSEEGSDEEEAPAAAAAVVQAAAAVVRPHAVAAPPAGSSSSTSGRSSSSSSTSTGPVKLSQVVDRFRDNPTLLAGTAAGLAATGGLLVLLSVLSSRRGDNQHAAGGKGSASGRGPNSKVKPTPTCVPLADGSAVIVHRPIAADNSCLFNAVGYCMHHSTNRAPFLRQVVSREVSSDPQVYSAAFLGMDNPKYCAWITTPSTWGGGIELAILASHYRREIAAWNLETGACHVFGEDAGYSKRVMVIYNTVHYDALAISPGPKAAQEEDATEFNPRTRRGKMIMAAAQKLVALNRRGKEGHHEQQHKQKEQQRQQRKQKKQSAAASPEPQQQQQQQQQGPDQQAAETSSGGKEQPAAANGHAPAAVAAQMAAAGGGGGSSGGALAVQMLGCQSCGQRLAGVDAARAHAAATGHVEYAEVD